MKLDIENIKYLREKTGFSLQECKTALHLNNGQVLLALEHLLSSTLKDIRKKDIILNQGIIYSYLHTNSRIGIMLELNCETDFVARKEEFRSLAKELALEILCSSIPHFYVSDIPTEVYENELYFEFVKSILSFKYKNQDFKFCIFKNTKKNLEKYALSCQESIFQSPSTIESLILKYIKLFGENIKLRRFVKYEIAVK